MNTDGWRKEIARAQDAEALLLIVQRFVHALDVVDSRILPERCRPAHIRNRQDIAFWSFALATAMIDEAVDPAQQVLGEIALVFSEAATKTTSLAVGRKAHTLEKNSTPHEEKPPASTTCVAR
jgi:hypothetical protein